MFSLTLAIFGRMGWEWGLTWALPPLEGHNFVGLSKVMEASEVLREVAGTEHIEVLYQFVFPVEHHLSCQTLLPRGLNQPAA